jgi:hypothetical protein
MVSQKRNRTVIINSNDPRAKKARFNPTFKIIASYDKTNNRIDGYRYIMGVYGYTISLSQDALNSFHDYYHKTYPATSLGGIEHSGIVNLMPNSYKSLIVHSQVGTAASVPLPTIGQDIPTILSSYHSHPPPQDPTINRSNLTSMPSDKDIRSYIANFPDMQVNFIVDINGIYIIDISRALRSSKMNKASLTTHALDQWHRLFVYSNLKRYIDVKSDTMFFEKTPELWNNILEFIRVTGINITYIDYNDRTELYEFDIDTVVPLENFDSQSGPEPMIINTPKNNN